MSFMSADRVKVFAESLEIEHLSTAAAKVLAPHLEVHLREIVQEASKFARHSKRSRLSTADVNNALRMRNIEPTYGFSSKIPARFLQAANHNDLFYVEDPVLSLDEVIEQPLSKCPAEVGVALHWLAIDGVQPSIPENAPVGQPAAKRRRTDIATLPAAATGVKQGDESAAGGDKAGKARPSKAGEGTTVQLPLAHVLSKELQTYYKRVADSLLQRPPDGAAAATADAQEAAPGVLSQQQLGIFASLATDPGLQPLVPYFLKLIAEEVPKQLRSLPILYLLLKAARALLSNEDLKLGPYMHLLMPALLSCVLTKRIGRTPMDDHWRLRDTAAGIIALACARLQTSYANLQRRVTTEYVKAFTDESKPLASHYGAAAGISALGPLVVRLLLLPQLLPYMATLTPLLTSSQPLTKRLEAGRVQSLLCHATCSALFSALRSDLAAGMLPAVRPASASKQKPAHIPATANPPFAHPAKLPTRAAAPPLQQDIPMVPSSPPAGPKHPAEAEQQLQQPVAAETPSVPLTRRVTRGSSEKGGSGKHESPLFRQDSATASPRGNASPNRSRPLTRRASKLAEHSSGLASPTDSPLSEGPRAGAQLASKTSDGITSPPQEPEVKDAAAQTTQVDSRDAAVQIEHQAPTANPPGPPATQEGVARKGNNVLANAWRADYDPGQALMALRDMFGEPMLMHFWPARLGDVFL